MLLSEPFGTGLLLLLFGVLVATSVLVGRWFERAGVPVALLFLILGILAGSEGIGRLPFENFDFAYRLGTIALVLILFDGGLNTRLSALRGAVAPAGVLATLGVALTAGLLALFARLIGLPWHQALLLGAVVSSTDAAAVFAVLRGGGVSLQQRLGSTIEFESGANDPMAVILTAAVTLHLIGEQQADWGLLFLVPKQLILGGLVGIGCGYVGRVCLIRIRQTNAGLFPALTIGLALLAYGVATVIDGSGFLSVYFAGIVVGNGAIPYAHGLRRVHDAFAWLCQIGMFLMLGLLVTPSVLVQHAGIGLLAALFLAFIARPLAVFLCLLPFRIRTKEVGYIGWVGLRGAVPIILATYPVLRDAPGAMTVFNIVFFIVIVSAITPGATVRWLARRLDLQRADPPSPPAALEINSLENLSGEIMSFYISKELAVCGARLVDITFPQGSSAVLVIRGTELIAPRGPTRFEEGDHVFVFCRPEDKPYIHLLFGRGE